MYCSNTRRSTPVRDVKISPGRMARGACPAFFPQRESERVARSFSPVHIICARPRTGRSTAPVLFPSERLVGQRLIMV